MDSWTCYLTFRLLFGLFDIFSDSLQAVSLLSLGHVHWGVLTLLFPLLAVTAAALAVLFGRCRRGDPMTLGKFAILTVKFLTTLCEGLLESGPELVLQATVIFHGVHLEDLRILSNPEEYWTWPWIRGILHILSVVSSCLSLLITLLYFNEERVRRGQTEGVKFSLALVNSLLCILFRVFLAAVLFSVVPWIALGIVLAVFMINTSVLFCMGLSFDLVFVSGYASLFAPSGYTKYQGSSTSLPPLSKRRYSVSSLSRTSASVAIRESFSEVERAKINQESLLKKVKVTYGSFNLASLLLLVPYVALLEIYHYPEFQMKSVESIIPQLSNRLVLYATPALLFLLTLGLSFLFIGRVRRSRDAARHWFSITPHRNRSGSDRSLDRSRVRINEVEVHLTDERFHRHSEASTAICSDTLKPTAPCESVEGDGCLPVCAEADDTTINSRMGPGTHKCGRSACVTCELFLEGSNFKSMMTGKDYRFMTPVSCETKAVIYLVTCSRCKKQYVGKTEQPLKQRHYGHRREIELQSTPLGKHFAGSCGYASWRIQIIDHDETCDGLKRKEGYWQHELMTLLPWGLNTRDELNGGTDISVH